MRLIDADALKMDKRVCGDRYLSGSALFVANKVIEQAPTIIEARPHGEWKALGFVHSRRYAWCTCSNCGKTTKIYLDNNDFCCIADIRNKAVACMYCGADMRGDEV